MGSIEQNQATVRAVFEVAEEGNLDALDALIDPDFILHDLTSSEEFRGVEGAKEMITLYRKLQGGLRITIEHQVSQGDFVATRYTARGTHQAEFMGVPATGRPVTVAGICISRLRDGKIVEEWEIADGLGALQQIGAIPEAVAG
jgi:steroid delta-isomerase-like uncharacterized protein